MASVRVPMAAPRPLSRPPAAAPAASQPLPQQLCLRHPRVRPRRATRAARRPAFFCDAPAGRRDAVLRGASASAAALLGARSHSLAAEIAGSAAGQPTAVVVGACGGIGAALARRLAGRGFRVVPCCRNAAKTAAAAAGISDTALAVGGGVESAVLDVGSGADLASVESAKAFVDALRGAGLRSVDTLVVASGVVSAPLSAGRTAEGFDLNIGVNVVGPAALTLAALPLLRAADGGGRVVFVTSTAALDTPSAAFLNDLRYSRRKHYARAAYAESKALDVLFTDELARREAALGTGVRANAIHPGPAATLSVRYELPSRYKQRLGMSAAQLDEQARRLGLRTADEAAVGAEWLAVADEAASATGQFFVDKSAPLPYEYAPAWRTPEAAAAAWDELVQPFT